MKQHLHSFIPVYCLNIDTTHVQSLTRLSLKCSAWKGCMNFALKKFSKKNFRSEKNVVSELKFSKKNLLPKNFCPKKSKKKFGSKKFWV